MNQVTAFLLLVLEDKVSTNQPEEHYLSAEKRE